MDAAQRAMEEEEEARLASASLAAGDPTGWFDRLYAAGARGQVPVPWRRRQPHPLLAHWASGQHPRCKIHFVDPKARGRQEVL